MISYEVLPAHMRASAQEYVEHGYLSGSFLTAVLENNLVEALGQADGINREMIFQWGLWLYSNCPAPAWGSKEKVAAWIKGFA